MNFTVIFLLVFANIPQSLMIIEPNASDQSDYECGLTVGANLEFGLEIFDLSILKFIFGVDVELSLGDLIDIPDHGSKENEKSQIKIISVHNYIELNVLGWQIKYDFWNFIDAGTQFSVSSSVQRTDWMAKDPNSYLSDTYFPLWIPFPVLNYVEDLNFVDYYLWGGLNVKYEGVDYSVEVNYDLSLGWMTGVIIKDGNGNVGYELDINLIPGFEPQVFIIVISISIIGIIYIIRRRVRISVLNN